VRALEPWVAAACTELGLRPDDVPVDLVLGVAKDVAHQVLRPGAPVTAYLLGVAVGRGADPADAAARLSALSAAWASRADRPAVPDGPVTGGRPADGPVAGRRPADGPVVGGRPADGPVGGGPVGGGPVGGGPVGGGPVGGGHVADPPAP
jgi:hypothetical protein